MPRLIRWVLAVAGLLLLLLTLHRVMTYVFFNGGRLTLNDALPAFWLGFRFDARVVAALSLPLLMFGHLRWITAFGSVAGRRCWLAYLGVACLILLLLAVCDFLHFRYLQQRLNATALGFLADAGISAGMVWQSYPVVRILLGGATGLAGLVGLLIVLHRRAAIAPDTAGGVARAGWFLGVGLVAGLTVFGRLGQYPLRWSDAFDLGGDFRANLALNPVQSLLSSMSFHGTGFDAAKVREHYPAMAAYLGVAQPDRERLRYERLAPARPRPDGVRPNVVLVLCESFSGYKSSMWGNPLDTTPFFAALCREGMFFDNAFTPHFGTARGVWALVTGLPDVAPVKTASRNPAMVDQHTIINDFIGYEKLYFLGGSTSWANIRGLLRNNIRGLRLFEEDSFRSPRVDVWGISDKRLFLEAHEVLRRQPQPFFAIIQTAGNHRPYTIPEEDLGEFTRVDLPLAELRRHGFDSLEELNAFRYTDHTFRKFLEAARAAPYFENTIFVFVGDHGIGGNAGAMFPPAWTDQALTSYHVPLLFYAPKLLPARRIGSVASMVDILPTLAGMAGIAYRNSGFGRDLLRQEQLDGGRSNAAFIIDHHSRTIGLIRGPYYATRQMLGDRKELVWADFRSPPPPTGRISPGPPGLDELVTGFHETARYLLLHNPKPE